MKAEGIKNFDLITRSPDAVAIDQNDGAIQALRQILESEQQRPVTLSEAQEIGEDLLAFYEALATPESVTQSVELLVAD
jgi:hypothetical protein